MMARTSFCGVDFAWGVVKRFIVVAVFLGAADLSVATTPAGTLIKNQASASYRDSDGIMHVATSNVVETLIQQVAAVQLAQNQSRMVVEGKQVFLSHTVTNTGNGSDAFSLAAVNGGVSDDFDLANLSIYPDVDQDGQPDVYATISVTPSLSIAETYSIVVAGNVAPGIPAGDVASLQITATSQFDTNVFTTNVDTATVADGAVVEVDKSISVNSGSSPDGPLVVSMRYRNVGTQAAQNVTLIDALPAGMAYVADSGRWNETGTTVLTDSNASDFQGTPGSIIYCAYHSSCGSVPEAGSDPDSDATNQVTAIVSEVPAGASGIVTFEVAIASGLNASELTNTAEFEYTSNNVVGNRYLTNSVIFSILHQPGIVVNGSQSVSTDGIGEPLIVSGIPQADQVIFANTVWNTGNAVDTFDLEIQRTVATFPAGSIYQLLQADGTTPLLDTNGNGLPDTGPLPVGGSYTYRLQVKPPTSIVGDNSGAGFEVGVSGFSATDASVTNPIANRLLEIYAAGLDITNVAAIGDVSAIGQGAGPEANPVSTLTASPGVDTVIALFINNTGQTSLSADLDVSTDAGFANNDLPDGWTVSFQLEGVDENITNTGVIDSGQAVLVNAVVAVPVGANVESVSLYFRAQSQVTGAVDIKHDVVSTSAAEQLLLELDQNGQTGPGGSYVYSHKLTNIGNVAVSGLLIATSDSANGWTSTIYEDSNSNGQLDSADLVVSAIASLPVGVDKMWFVKVFAPTTAAALSTNQTQVTASWNSGVDSVTATDTTTVAEIEISILKEQAPDFGCTGTLDGSYGVSGFVVVPGNNCVSYRLTATNAGQGTAFNIDVADATPAFTAYFGSAACSHNNCSIVEPVVGGQGKVVASLPSLNAGDVVTLSFTVRVE